MQSNSKNKNSVISLAKYLAIANWASQSILQSQINHKQGIVQEVARRTGS